MYKLISTIVLTAFALWMFRDWWLAIILIGPIFLKAITATDDKSDNFRKGQKMQNRYLCDIGDFGKYGMLREVIKTNLNLGLNWYLYPNESHNNDGKHKRYLKKDKHNVGACDIELYKFLQSFNSNTQNTEFSVNTIEKSDILPRTVFYNQQLGFEYVPDWEIRKENREKWFANSLETLSNCDIVFCDPDNGFEVSSVGHMAIKSGKYIFFDEAKQLYDSGKSIIAYHHGPLWFKNGEMEPFVIELSNKIRNQVASDAKIVCLRWQTTAKRFYFWIIRPEHEKSLLTCINKLTTNEWGNHLTLVRTEETI